MRRPVLGVGWGGVAEKGEERHVMGKGNNMWEDMELRRKIVCLNN